MNNKEYLAQIDKVLIDITSVIEQSKHEDLSDIPDFKVQALITRTIAAINRIAGPDSTYSKEVERVIKLNPQMFMHNMKVFGVLAALRSDVADDYLKTFAELVHAEMFADFLEMSSHLLESGYKDAAAVITGSALEAHLRLLCVKHSLSIELVKSDGTIIPKKADQLNSDLTSSSAYSKLDQKNVTAWLDLRNKAAHGKYTEYTIEQCSLMLSGVRDFIARTPG